MAEPTFVERLLIQHKDYLAGSCLVVSNVIDISDSDILTSEGRLVPYDYLVIATGHGAPLPKTRAERLKQYQAVHKGYWLLEFLGVKASKKTLDWLQSKHIEVKLEQTLNLEDLADGSKLYKTSAGETIKANCVFLCLGKPLASSWLKNTIVRDSLDANESMIVDENFKSQGAQEYFFHWRYYKHQGTFLRTAINQVLDSLCDLLLG
ncbi:FAD/NAD(P)-binding oxidoreductase family protein [Tanacetum coccineum]